MKRHPCSLAAVALVLLTAGCNAAPVDEATASAEAPPSAATSPSPAPPPSIVAEADEPASAAVPAQVSLEEAADVLYPVDEDARAAALAACPGESVEARVRCMIAQLYEEVGDDEDAATAAVSLYDALGTVAGRERAYEAEVGWRGRIQFVPALPAGSRKKRRHLDWIVDGFTEIDALLTALDERAGDDGIPYRWRALTVRFYQTVDRTTPSAYAHGWEIAWNLDGSLHKSKQAALETLFHELFHLNDFDHDRWSRGELTELFEDLVARCTEEGDELPSTRCLKPFAPGKTKVKGGTYYAFQPGNGVHEYAAELATRYFLEQRAWLTDARDKPDAFKCGPEENARAWQLLADEFFAGVDLVPACE